MLRQRPGKIGAFVGTTVGAVLILFFATPVFDGIQSVVQQIKGTNEPVNALLVFSAVIVVNAWLGYVFGMLGALLSRSRSNWVPACFLAGAVGFGGLLAYLLELTFAEGAVFAAATVLFACWLFDTTGTPIGALTENRGVGLLVTIGFSVALFLCFTDVARTGSLFPESPVSFMIVVLLCLPYAFRSVVQCIWN